MNPDGNTPIILNLTLDTTNVVLGALSAQPYERVAGLIAAIQQQAAMQLQAKQSPAEPVDVPAAPAV